MQKDLTRSHIHQPDASWHLWPRHILAIVGFGWMALETLRCDIVNIKSTQTHPYLICPVARVPASISLSNTRSFRYVEWYGFPTSLFYAHTCPADVVSELTRDSNAISRSSPFGIASISRLGIISRPGRGHVENHLGPPVPSSLFSEQQKSQQVESEPYSNEPWYLRKVSLKCPHGIFWGLTVGVCRTQKPLVVLPILGWSKALMVCPSRFCSGFQFRDLSSDSRMQLISSTSIHKNLGKDILAESIPGGRSRSWSWSVSEPRYPCSLNINRGTIPSNLRPYLKLQILTNLRSSNHEIEPWQRTQGFPGQRHRCEPAWLRNPFHSGWRWPKKTLRHYHEHSSRFLLCVRVAVSLHSSRACRTTKWTSSSPRFTSPHARIYLPLSNDTAPAFEFMDA